MTGVLLVDDEPLVLVGIQSMLKWEDYDAQVVGAATAPRPWSSSTSCAPTW